MGSEHEIGKPRLSGDDMSQPPLEGIRVIELGHALAGPLAGTLLGDFGADVVKVERPGTGDSLREMGPKFNDSGVWWAVTGRNKRSVCIDLKHSRGRELVLALVGRADVLIENFRPGVLDRLGLGWENVRATFPRLVMLRVSGYGQSGPYTERGGFGKIAEAFAGATHLTGEPEGPPVHPGFSLGDATTGLMGAFGVMMALYERDRSGRGQLIDLALYESLFRLIEWQVPLQQLLGETAWRNGARFPFDGAFITDICQTSNGESVVVSAATTESLDRLRAFVNAEGRKPATDDTDGGVVDGLRSWIAEHTRDEALGRLRAEGLVVGPVLSAADIVEDPHIRARGSIATVQSRDGTEIPMPTALPVLSETPGSVRWAGPRLGEHTEEVLTETLGLTRAQCIDLAEEGVIALAEARGEDA